MRSHRYDFHARDLLQVVGSCLAVPAAFALLMHSGAAFKVFPPPRPTLDMDRTILLHQAAATQVRHEARLVLIGDSSCMMDVGAEQLSRSLKQETINLGTLSYLDQTAYASLLTHYVQVNSNALRTVVVLLHPESLRRTEGVRQHFETLECFYEQKDCCRSEGLYDRLSCWLGLEIFRGRFLSRVLPVPVSGAFGYYYGFTPDLWRHLSEHSGSAVDPHQYVPAAGQGNAEYRLSPRIRAASRALRAAVPKQAKLIVGLTPIPESFAPGGYPDTYRQILSQWGAWIEADVTLTNLPPTLPDKLFASTTHLNEAGAGEFTRVLSTHLGAHLR